MRVRRISATVISIILLIVAVAIRFVHLGENTEFLGDQGRTFLHVYEAWQFKRIPLVGPTVLSGQYLGPAYYFLIAPFLIGSGFQLSSGAVATIFYAGLGIVFSAMTFRILFALPIAMILTALWAFNPYSVSIDRFLWEPNLVPTFAMMFIFGTVTLLKTRNKIVGSVSLGVATGILVQLHYPNILFLPLSLLIFLMAFYKKHENAKALRMLLVYIVSFLSIVCLFLGYEFTHGFENSYGVISQFIHPSGDPIGKRQILRNIIDYASRVMGKVSPVSLGIPMGAFILCALSFLWLVVERSNLSFIMACSIFGGVGALALYRGVVYDHYLYFLTPSAYMILGYWMNQIYGVKKLRVLLIVAVIILLLISLRESILRVYKTPVRGDILRVEEVGSVVKKELGNTDFSFGLVTSPSFSDLHYRAAFTLKGLNAHKISANDRDIVLVCESLACPFVDHGGKQQTLCNEDHCGGQYPVVDLDLYTVRVTKTPDVMILFGHKISDNRSTVNVSVQ